MKYMHKIAGAVEFRLLPSSSALATNVHKGLFVAFTGQRVPVDQRFSWWLVMQSFRVKFPVYACF